MSDLVHYAKTGGKVALDVLGEQGALVGFADATGYYYASQGLNWVLQTQFQASGWPQGITKIPNNSDVKASIMFARDQYYAKAKSALGGAFWDLGKDFLAGLGTGYMGWAVWGGFKAWSVFEGKSKLETAYNDMKALNNPKGVSGQPLVAAQALVRFSWDVSIPSAKSKEQAAFAAVQYILGTEFPAYQKKEFAYKDKRGAINRVASWLA